MSRLIAKRPHRGRALPLRRHLLDTEKAASLLFRPGSRWAAALLRFFKLPDTEHARFLLHLRTAALLHDLGKANDGFQRATRARGFRAQPFRHEHLSALILAHPAVTRWLDTNPALDQDVIVAAVLSHHLKASPRGEHEVMGAFSRAATPVALADEQVMRTWASLAALADLTGSPPSLASTYRADDHYWQVAYDRLVTTRAPKFASAIRKDHGRRALCLAVKVGLVAADSVSSALVREDLDTLRWVEEVAHAAPLSEAAIEQAILAPRIEELSGTSPSSPFSYHRFQLSAASAGSRALLLAPCGTGKTLAAWRWAQEVARTHPIGRVVFVYPARGMSTEGFRHHVGHAPEGAGHLIHGAARHVLEGMRSSPPELPAALRAEYLPPAEDEDRLFSLGLWPRRYFSATADQVLGFLQHDYRGLCMLPALADAAVIFDELHSYDDTTWRSLVDFLAHFDVPVLCMSATLPPERRAALEPHLRACPGADEPHAPTHVQERACHPRYRVERADSEADAFERVIAAAAEARVLWVVNTVGRCQRLAARLRARLGEPVLVYHSSFKLEDRARRHRDTVEAFRARGGGPSRPVIAVTTQVCEASLDLDADLLVTEHAPLTSLVQRFGRANRLLRHGPDFRARLITYAAESPYPYDPDELQLARDFLASFEGRAVSLHELAEALTRGARGGRTAERGDGHFLTGGLFATRGSSRDLDDCSAAAILDADRHLVESARTAERPIDELLVPVPRKHVTPGPHEGLPPWLSVAPADRYSAEYGFLADDDLVELAPRSPPAP